MSCAKALSSAKLATEKEGLRIVPQGCFSDAPRHPVNQHACPMSEAERPIAHDGYSDRCMMEPVRRRGLAHRYGKRMQLIASAAESDLCPHELNLGARL